MIRPAAAAMKLQAVMNRSTGKQGTDLLDILRLILDPLARPVALTQIRGVDAAIAHDMALHVDLWFRRNLRQAQRWSSAAEGSEITTADLTLVAELLDDALNRP